MPDEYEIVTEFEKAYPLKKKRGFGGMDPKKQRELASRGGKRAHALGTAHRFTTEEAISAGKLGKRGKIHDEFTKLSVSRQRKWQLRHPEKARELAKKKSAKLHI